MIFRQPKNMRELAEVLASRSEKSILAAGCTDILPQKIGKPWDADEIIDLTRVPKLREIRLEDGELFIGACCTHAQIAENETVRTYFTALAQACSQVGSVQIRNRGTIGGNVANASPAADTVPCLMLFGAKTGTIGSCITGFRLPLPKENTVSAFEKLGDREIVTIARIQLALKSVLQDGRLSEVKVVVGAAGEKPFFCEEAAAVLEGSRPEELPEEAFAEALSRAVEASIPARSTMPYKRKAVYGPAFDLLAKIRY